MIRAIFSVRLSCDRISGPRGVCHVSPRCTLHAADPKRVSGASALRRNSSTLQSRCRSLQTGCTSLGRGTDVDREPSKRPSPGSGDTPGRGPWPAQPAMAHKRRARRRDYETTSRSMALSRDKVNEFRSCVPNWRQGLRRGRRVRTRWQTQKIARGRVLGAAHKLAAVAGLTLRADPPLDILIGRSNPLWHAILDEIANTWNLVVRL